MFNSLFCGYGPRAPGVAKQPPAAASTPDGEPAADVSTSSFAGSTYERSRGGSQVEPPNFAGEFSEDDSPSLGEDGLGRAASFSVVLASDVQKEPSPVTVPLPAGAAPSASPASGPQAQKMEAVDANRSVFGCGATAACCVAGREQFSNGCGHLSEWASSCWNWTGRCLGAGPAAANLCCGCCCKAASCIGSCC